MRTLDVRWMRDEPGFFGSFGYKGWTGVGEAQPTGVMHELGHAYWGLFPVSGLPDLGWDAGDGERLSPAIERYHRDVLVFMAQPPDGFELLRSRLRNIPELSSDDPEGLLHSVEADMVYTTGGDLDLVPPILRKYWDRMLRPGPFHSWYGALRWYQALPPQERRLANEYVGFEHFDLRDYGSLKGPDPNDLREGTREVLENEEARRLQDFVELFDRLVGSPEHAEDFKFWRRYLRDKIALHKRYPHVAVSLSPPRSGQLAAAMGFLSRLDGETDVDKASLIIGELEVQPFLSHFLPALDDRTLLKLFTSGAMLPEGATLKGTTAFVASLEKFTPDIQEILEAGRSGVSEGAGELTAYLDGVDFEEKEDLELFFEVLQGADDATTRAISAALDDSMLRRLLEVVPARLRTLLTPVRFLEFLDITLNSSVDEMSRGIEDMISYPSGNFRIDEPFVSEMYRIVAARARSDPARTLEIVARSSFPMKRFLGLHPVEAVDLLSGDLTTASAIVRAGDPLTFPPSRYVYRLIYADPELAARIIGLLDAQGERDLVIESLAHFAYDADRLQAVPGLPISLNRDGRFLAELLEGQGNAWLEDRIVEAVARYHDRVRRDEVPRDFLKAYETTLRAASATLGDGEARRSLDDILDRAF